MKKTKMKMLKNRASEAGAVFWKSVSDAARLGDDVPKWQRPELVSLRGMARRLGGEEDSRVESESSSRQELREESVASRG